MTPKKEKDSNVSIMNLVGLSILIVCYLGAIWNVFKTTKDEISYNKVIRLCHWQLEMGVTTALDEMMKRYAQAHPDRKVIQIPITERAYAQWVTTQLIGRTAPDLIEIGMFNVNDYLGRYFRPVTDDIMKPNPYNKDNQFKDTPWMNTFLDGLQNSYKPELLDYYGVGFSQYSVRMFYNKTLFERILKRNNPPQTLEALFKDCQTIQQYVKDRNAGVAKYNKEHPPKWWQRLPFMPSTLKNEIQVIPIASSKYQLNLFRSRYAGIFTADICIDSAKDNSGSMTVQDNLEACITGALSTATPKYKTYMELIRDMAKFFPDGFMSIDRMDSGFSFVQGRAAMITSGSWDASSFLKQVADQPFGDIILSINNKEVVNAKEAAKELMALAKDKKKAVLHINREGGKITRTIEPQSGADLMSCYGLELADFKTKEGKPVTVVITVDSKSPADNAGLTQRKTFEVGIFDFPLPNKADPVYGKYYAGPVAESVETGFNFGITKFSRNPDIALDFMQFCTTPENNQKLNEIAQWVPAVKGAQPTEFLKAFTPNYKGFWGALTFEMGTRTKTILGQMLWPYTSRETDYEAYSKKFLEMMPQAAAYDYDEAVRLALEAVPEKQVLRSMTISDYLFSEKDTEKAYARQKMVAAWEVVIDYQLKYPMMKAQLGGVFEQRPDTPFAQAFFDNYDKIKTRE